MVWAGVENQFLGQISIPMFLETPVFFLLGECPFPGEMWGIRPLLEPPLLINCCLIWGEHYQYELVLLLS